MRLINSLTKHVAAILAFSASVVVAEHRPTHQHTVEVLNWANYIDMDVVVELSDEIEMDVNVVGYERADDAEALLTARGSNFDLAIVASESVGRLVQSGALMDLSDVTVANRGRLEQGLWQHFTDTIPEAANHVIPYSWGTLGLAYDIEAITARLPDTPIDSWALLFEPENAAALADCGISIVDSNEEVLAAILSYLGRDPHSTKEEDIDAAFEVLEAIAPYVRFFDTDQYEALTSGEVCLAVSWSSELFWLISEGEYPNARYVVPKEGSNIWADVFVVPVDAAHVGPALELINGLAEPAHFSTNAHTTLSIVRDSETRRLIDAPFYDHPALRLPDEVLERLYYVRPMDSEGKARLDKRWRKMQLGL